MRINLNCGLAAIFLVAGCSGETTNSAYMYREKPTTKTQKASAMLQCEVYSTKEVPASNQTSVTPQYRTPTYTTPVNCYTGYGGYTSCTGGQTYGGNIVGGNVSTTDANSGLRYRLYKSCMAEKGYKTTEFPLPMCRKEQIPAGYVTPETILHAPVEGACAINPTQAQGGSVILLPRDQLSPNKS